MPDGDNSNEFAYSSDKPGQAEERQEAEAPAGGQAQDVSTDSFMRSLGFGIKHYKPTLTDDFENKLLAQAENLFH